MSYKSISYNENSNTMAKETKPKSSFEEMMTDNEPQVIQLAPGLTSEEMIAEYLNDDELIEQPVTVYRLNSSSHRYYYTFGEDGEPNFCELLLFYFPAIGSSVI